MFRKLFNLKKPRLYLKSITVVPTDEGMDEQLKEELEGIFGKPHTAEIPDLTSTDLGLEIFVPDYRLGDAGVLWLGIEGAAVPLMFRPRIELRARLFQIESGRTVKVFTVRRKMAIKKGFARMFSWGGMIDQTFTPRDVQALFFDACKELIDDLRPYQ